MFYIVIVAICTPHARCVNLHISELQSMESFNAHASYEACPRELKQVVSKISFNPHASYEACPTFVSDDAPNCWFQSARLIRGVSI